MPPDRSAAPRRKARGRKCNDRNITRRGRVQTPLAALRLDLSGTVRFSSFLIFVVVPIVLIRHNGGNLAPTALMLPAIAAADRSHLRFHRKRES